MSQQQLVDKNTHPQQLNNPRIFDLSIKNAQEVKRFFNRQLEKHQSTLTDDVFNLPIARSA